METLISILSFRDRSAWTDRRQALFIESLILGLPIPQLILAEDQNRKGSFIVIDGKQRLLSLRRFSAERHEDFDQLKLQGLDVLKHLNRKTLDELRASPSYGAELAAFDNSSIRTVIIRNWKSEAYLYEVFLRINTGSVQLSPQELRQALHPGEFSRFVDYFSAESAGLRQALGIEKPDFRMRDAELLLRYISYKLYISDYRGNLKIFLDQATKRLNAEWSEKEGVVRHICTEMEAAFAFTEEVFGHENVFRKWNGERYERQRNRAVFDIMLYFFSERVIRESLHNKSLDIEQSFKFHCTHDAEFRSSLETTTKSIEANRERFNTWGKIISKISGQDIRLPFPA